MNFQCYVECVVAMHVRNIFIKVLNLFVLHLMFLFSSFSIHIKLQNSQYSEVRGTTKDAKSKPLPRSSAPG